MSDSTDYPSLFDDAALRGLVHLARDLRRFVEGLWAEGSEGSLATAREIPGSAMPGLRGKGFFETVHTILFEGLRHPESLAKHYGAFADLVLRALAGETVLTPAADDRRFKDELWRTNPFFRGLLQIYLAWNRSMQSWLDEQDLSGEDRQRAQFIFDQVASAFTPSNLPINPAALKRAVNTHGTSFVTGVQHWLDDVLHNKAMPRQILPNAYRLGRDLASTSGSVVFRNPQLELIQYGAQSDRVYRRPVLLIPPQINKFYLFDLRPSNSLAEYLVQHGFQVFAISWWNPSESEASWGMDTYIAATLEAMEVISEITSCRTLNLMSACAGGITAMILLGYLAEKKRKVITSHSLFVTSLLSDNRSIVDRFATAGGLHAARAWSRHNGVMDGASLSKIFCWLRPDDLVWNFWVNNYLMGRKPHALDVLYWDNDPTQLPARLHEDFLEIYAREAFEKPHTLEVLGARVDFGKVRVDTYFTGGLDDYLSPWESVYRTAKFFRGRHEFVLSEGGHVQSILRPPALAKIHYFTNTNLPKSPQEWRETSTRQDGSWWPHWIEWLARRSGRSKAAPRGLGSARYSELMAAPGSYVFKRS